MKNVYIKRITDIESGSDISGHIEAYCVHLRSLKQSKTTITLKRHSVERFFISSEVDAPGDITLNMLEDYRVTLNKQGLSENTIDSYMRGLKNFFSYLEEMNLIFDNPFRRIKLHAVKKRKMAILTRHEINKLLSLPPNHKQTYFRNRAIFEILYSTAVRSEEIRNLKIRDIDLGGRNVRVIGKGRKERVLPLGRKASEYIDQYLVTGRPLLVDPDAPNCDDLWLDLTGGKMTRGALQMLLVLSGQRAIGRRIGCHMIRRTCVTHMLENGAHPVMISQMLGHSSLSTLSHYLNVSMKELMKTYRKSVLSK